jgi:uncharacterized protein (UPF0335 family)
MQAKEVIAKLVRLYTEEESIAEQVKDIKSEAKESGLDPAILSAVAKAVVKNKVDDLKDKSNATLAAIDIARS